VKKEGTSRTDSDTAADVLEKAFGASMRGELVEHSDLRGSSSAMCWIPQTRKEIVLVVSRFFKGREGGSKSNWAPIGTAAKDLLTQRHSGVTADPIALRSLVNHFHEGCLLEVYQDQHYENGFLEGSDETVADDTAATQASGDGAWKTKKKRRGKKKGKEPDGPAASSGGDGAKDKNLDKDENKGKDRDKVTVPSVSQFWVARVYYAGIVFSLSTSPLFLDDGSSQIVAATRLMGQDLAALAFTSQGNPMASSWGSRGTPPSTWLSRKACARITSAARVLWHG
jgi:hypothetical protein